ncbi:hypothetical protein M9Y10_012736 [Tritrichomonas musculus]|uniref:Ribosome assembly protein 3 n=1 Tax=Tritrichomonas musculus TaxID=1915356 RepID=A0ABR2IDC2_9EUKA
MKSTADIVNEEMDKFEKERKKKKEDQNKNDKADKENDNNEEEDSEDENRTDKKLFSDILKDENDDDDNEKVVLNNDEDFVEVDGVKTVSFSLNKEMKEGHFDKNGNYIPNQEEEENEENHTYSTETSENDEDTSKLYVSSLEQLISLIPPQKNATEALKASAKDNDRLNAITDCATNLFSLGEMRIYTETIEELKEKLKSNKK